ncbi:HAD family hydrolase [Paenirhodobacter sp.]|uniref:HAD family hydrolase n=1 Tax=Paenirhodobacter sp. TaxID=1965326 RepID=UPI003B40FC2A
MTEPAISGIAWDVDGTLVDSEPVHHRGLIAVCLELGVDLRADPPERFLGMNQDAIWAVLAPQMPEGIDRAGWKTRLQDHFVAAVHEAHPMPGALDVMRAFAEAGIAQVAVSNSGRRVMEASLSTHGMAPFLRGMVSFDDVTHGKPDPEPYRKGLALLGLPAQQVLAVEDSGTGARSARTAGLRLAALGAAQTVGGHPIGSLSELPALVLRGGLR